MASNVDAKLLKSTKFPQEFSQKVDMQKVNVEVMKKWIAGKISEILGNEDDIVIELCFNLLEGSRFPDIKVLQIQLTGFLDKETAKFCKELWLLCLSAQDNPQGVPKELLEAKKLELIQAKIDAEKAAKDAQVKRESEHQRERQLGNIRQRERDERGGRGMGRGERDRYDRPRRPPRDSRSPPPRRRSPRPRDDYKVPTRREVDTYIPSGHRQNPYLPSRRRASTSPRSQSPPRRSHRDFTPPRRRRYSTSRSCTPPLREHRGSRSFHRGDGRQQSPVALQTSRSPSTRPSSRGGTRSFSSKSSTPPADRQHDRRRREVRSRESSSRSISRERHRRPRRRSPSYDSGKQRNRYADNRKGRPPSLSPPPRQRNLTIGHRNRRDRLTPPPLSRSRSPERRDRRPEKRRRSRERYAPPARRRRNTSSVTPPNEKRRKTADSSADEGTTKPIPGEQDIAPQTNRPANAASPSQLQLAVADSVLREKALRDKLKAMRRNSNDHA